MPKFIVRARETAVFEYEFDVADHEAARQAYQRATEWGGGRLVEPVRAETLAVYRLVRRERKGKTDGNDEH